MPVTEEQIAALSKLLERYEPAFSNFGAMSLSVIKLTRGRILTQRQTPDGRNELPGWWTELVMEGCAYGIQIL